MQLFPSKKFKQLEEKNRQLEEQVKSLPKITSTLNALQVMINSNILQVGSNFINDSIARYPDWGISEITSKYTSSDHIYSIINKITETSVSMPFATYIKKEDKSYKQYNTITGRQFYSNKGLYDIMRVQRKALVDAPETDGFYELMETPNTYQTKDEFITACYIYYLLNGEAFIWKEKITAGANEGTTKYMHVLAPECVVLHVTARYPQTITGYSYVVNGQTILDKVKPENIIHWKRFNPCKVTFNADDLRGLSPIKTLTNPLRRLEEADTRSVSQIKNGGVPGIVYDESIGSNDLSQTEFDLQRKAFYDFIQNDQNTEAPFFVGNKKGYLPLGLKLADMELLELGKVDFKRACNVYKVSHILFNSDDASTESNVQEMIKQMITNACLPMVYALRNKLNDAFKEEFDSVQDIDISNITELQDDMLALANAIAAMPAAPSVNEQRELWKYERIEGEEYDKPLIKQGYVFIEEMIVPGVDNNLLQ